MLFVASYKGTPGCTGRYTSVQCNLSPAVYNYELKVVGNTTNYLRGETPRTSPTPADTLFTPPFGFMPISPHTLNSLLVARVAADRRQEAFAAAARGLFETEIAAMHNGKWWLVGDPSSNMSMTWRAMRAAAKAVRPANPESPDSSPCNMVFENPMPKEVEVMHDLAVRVSVLAATEANITQRVRFSGEERGPRWVEVPVYFAFAILCPVMVFINHIYMWWGAWRLLVHREMTPAMLVRLLWRVVMEANDGTLLEGVQPEAIAVEAVEAAEDPEAVTEGEAEAEAERELETAVEGELEARAEGEPEVRRRVRLWRSWG